MISYPYAILPSVGAAEGPLLSCSLVGPKFPGHGRGLVVIIPVLGIADIGPGLMQSSSGPNVPIGA